MNFKEQLFKKIINNIKIINILSVLSFTILYFLLLRFWFDFSKVTDIDQRIALDINNFRAKQSEIIINLEGEFTSFEEKPSNKNLGKWHNFRGPFSDNISYETIPLISNLNAENLPYLWEVSLGEGYAGAAVANGSVYIIDYNKAEKKEMLRCFSFYDGKEIWRRSYNIDIKRNHGITRTVPAVNDKYAVSLGAKCHVLCVDAITGDYKWGIDLAKRYNTKVPLWYAGQCPLIYENMAIIAPGGDALIIGVNLEDGDIVFETPNTSKYEMSHASVIPMQFAGRKVFVYTPIGGIVAVSAEKEDYGKIIFETKEWSHTVVSPSPVYIKPDRFFVTAGYGSGSMMFKVETLNNELICKQTAVFNKKQFACEQHTPIFYKNHLFTILPNDAGEMKRELVCMDLKGKMIWRSGKESRFGLGPFIVADNKFFILDDNGVLTIAKADTNEYKELSKVKVLNGRESWAPIAISEGRILLRDFNKMICLDIRKRK